MKRSRAFRRTRSAICAAVVSAALACVPHPSPNADMEPGTIRTADSARSVQAERSRSSASQVVDFAGDDRTRYSRVEQMIQAKFSGVQVISLGGSYTIRIRGSGSFTSGNDPLVIIDGASRSTADLRSISPVDVRRIEIVKDGAASFYGSRGANGVIIITTGRDP